MPFEVVALDEPKVRETYERKLVLVRPDGHVAWRGDAIPEKPSEIIDKVRGADNKTGQSSIIRPEQIIAIDCFVSSALF